MAYIKSPLFKSSLQVCKYFKLISDVYRVNETNGRDNEYAGPNLFKEFINLTKDFQDISKVKTMIFSRQKKNALDKLNEVGLKEEDYPIIASKWEEFVEFLK